MYRKTKLLTLAFFLGAFLFGLNAFAGKSVDWPGFAEGAASLAVIDGKIKSLDLEKMSITLEESEMLGNEPLFLGKDTICYMGDAKINIVSIRGGTKFQKEDELSFDHLKAGDYVKCNYSIRDGKFWAVRIVLITPYLKVE
jgi:Cu/Ag efflux protein CusF